MRNLHILWMAASLVATAEAQTVYDINTLTDDAGLADAGDGLCAVREAIANINADADLSGGDCPLPGGSIDTLTFSVSGTILLDGAALVTESNVVFSGPGHDQLEISGGDASGVIEVQDGIAVLRKISITHGNSEHGAIWLSGGSLLFVDRCAIHDNESTSHGGGIYMGNPAGNLVLTGSAIYNNSASGGGGGLYADGPVESVANSTFSGNFALRGGGAIKVNDDSLIANNITVFNNLADTLAGGIHTDAYFEVKNSIIAGNWDISGSVYLDCSVGTLASAEYQSAGYNLFGSSTGCKADPADLTTTAPTLELDWELKVNGSGTPTHALIYGSQAIDAGDAISGGTPAGACSRTPSGQLIIDQRHLSRARGAGMGGAGCDIGAFEAQDEIPGVDAEIELFLEGPYVGGATMDAGHLYIDFIAQGQPYKAGVFNGTSLDYDGLEAIDYNAVPAEIVDWMVISLRSGTDGASEVARGVGLLKADGTLEAVGPDGGPIPFSGVAPGPYYVVVDHWSHVSAMSADPVDFSSGTGGYSFKGASSAYTGGGAPQKDLGDSFYGLFACDLNYDGIITAPDFNIWNAETTAGATGYTMGDCNMDGLVTAPDFNLWNANTTAGAASQVPN